MGVYDASGTRISKGAISKTAVTEPDPEFTITADYYKSFEYDNVADARDDQEGRGRARAFYAGQVVRQSEIDALYPAATVDTLTPATGLAAGGTVVTIKGTNLDGVTGVTFGGTAGTAYTYVDQETIRVTTPAKTAGTYNVVVADDSGTVTKTNGFVYT